MCRPNEADRDREGVAAFVAAWHRTGGEAGRERVLAFARFAGLAKVMTGERDRLLRHRAVVE